MYFELFLLICFYLSVFFLLEYGIIRNIGVKLKFREE